MHNMTININANKIKRTPNTIDQSPPRIAVIVEVANVKIANTNNIMIARANEIIEIYLGRQWVNVILKSPKPIAIISV